MSNSDTSEDEQPDPYEVVRPRFSMKRLLLEEIDETADESHGGNSSALVRRAVWKEVNETMEDRILHNLEQLRNDIQKLIDESGDPTVWENDLGDEDVGASEYDSSQKRSSDGKPTSIAIYSFLSEMETSVVGIDTLFSELDYPKSEVIAGVERLESKGVLQEISDSPLQYTVDTDPKSQAKES